MQSSRTGTYIPCGQGSGETYRAYVPAPLPPSPPLRIEEFYGLLDRANSALGRLEGMSRTLPDPSFFLYMYVRKEAVLSSQIEGTQSSLSDLLLFESDESPGVPLDDIMEVSNYVAAMNYGLARLKTLPLSLRLIREIHEKLMQGARGGHKMPGEFRTSQNWIGGTRPGNARFVPPPPERLMETLDAFEKFLHEEKHPLPLLVKAAMAHVQFETIHPFLDGNGRLGRLLVTFILCADGLLQEPMLYLSLYLKTHRQIYYDLLQSVRETGNWEDWIKFFLTGVAETADQAVQTAQDIVALFDEDRKKIVAAGKLTANAVSLHAFFKRTPAAGAKTIHQKIGTTITKINRGLSLLEELNILKEVTGKGRNRVYAYKAYIDILNKGTEPL